MTINEHQFKVTHTLASYYCRDARDFVDRFDILWKRLLHKTGRMKSFIDLYMGCECALKAHIFLLRIDDDPKEVYADVRRMGHSVSDLSVAANRIRPQPFYEEICNKLSGLSVLLRYSVDMWETFYKFNVDKDTAEPTYARTIANRDWVFKIRSLCKQMIDDLPGDLSAAIDSSVPVAQLVSRP